MSNAAPAVAPQENFAALFEESLTRKEMRTGEVITAEVVRVDMNYVVVNAGLKSESFIALEEFKNDKGEVEVKPGDFTSVAIEALEDGYGETRLSRDKAKRLAAWLDLEQALEAATLVNGIISRKVNGGLTVMTNGIRAFLPGSLVDIRPVKDTMPHAGQEMDFTVITHNDYGAFVEVEQGIEGLVHVSEMDWTNKNVHPSKVVALGDEVEVMILEIDEERRRISLGMKQCLPNPWEEFSMNFKKGDKVRGPIKSITDFGIFIGLQGGIDGLVHLSDLSWTLPGEEAVRSFKKGEETEAQVLSIDVERERISLGIKQLEGDPFNNFVASHEKGKLISGTVKSVDAKGAVISMGGDLEGYLRASEISRDRVEDARNHLKEGDSVTAMVINVDRKNRTINLSVKQKEFAEENEAMAKLQSESAASTGSTNLGALLKAKLDNKNAQQ